MYQTENNQWYGGTVKNVSWEKHHEDGTTKLFPNVFSLTVIVFEVQVRAEHFAHSSLPARCVRVHEAFFCILRNVFFCILQVTVQTSVFVKTVGFCKMFAFCAFSPGHFAKTRPSILHFSARGPWAPRAQSIYGFLAPVLVCTAPVGASAFGLRCHHTGLISGSVILFIGVD